MSNINRGTLAIKQLTNRVFKMCITCTYTCIQSFVRIVLSGSLSQIVCKTIFSSEVFCGFEFNLSNSSSIAPTCNSAADLIWAVWRPQIPVNEVPAMFAKPLLRSHRPCAGAPSYCNTKLLPSMSIFHQLWQQIVNVIVGVNLCLFFDEV